MKKFLNFICCSLDSDDEQLIEDKQISIKKEEKTSLELFGNLATLQYMLVRMTQKNFFVDFSMRKSKLVEKNPQTVFISYVSEEVQYEFEETKYLIPEKVLQYIARRMREIKPSFIVDGLSRSGISAIQFSSESNSYVLGNNFSTQQIRNAVHNQSICKLDVKCDFIQTSQFKLPIIQNDLLYIQPDYQIYELSLSVDNIFPSLNEILGYAFKQSKNVILVLPHQINIDQLCEQFSISLKQNYLENLMMELQKIQIDGQMHYIIAYFGEIAAIQMQDEYVLMTEMALADTNQENLYDSTYMLLKNIGYTRSARELMDLLIESKNADSSETTLQLLINKLLRNGYTNEETVKQLFGANEILQSETPKYNDIQEIQNTFGNECQIQNHSPKKKKNAKKSQFISFNIPSE